VGFVLLQDFFTLSPSALLLIWGLTSVVSMAAATAVWSFSDDSKPPAFWRFMSFMGFMASLMIIYTTAKEIVNVVLAFGVVFEVTQSARLSGLRLGVEGFAVRG